MDADAIRARLKEIRRASGLSQTAFAQSLGMPARTYQAYEGGERDLSLEALDQLYAHYDVNPLWLLRGEGTRNGSASSIASAVLKGLLDRWERYPVSLSNAEKVDDFERVLSHASSAGFSESILDIAVRRVG